MNFVQSIPSGKTGLPFQKFRCSRKFFYRKDPTSRVPFPFQQDFLKTFCKWQTTLAYKWITGINLCIFDVFFSHHVSFVDGTHA